MWWFKVEFKWRFYKTLFFFTFFSFLLVISVKMFVTFEPVDADTVWGDVLRVVFYSWEKFLVSGYESRKSLWLSKMTSVFILIRYFPLTVLTAKNAHKSGDIRFLFSICRLYCIPLILEGLAVHMSGVNSAFFNKR